MTESKQLSIAVGVVKFDYRKAGYPDVMKKAKEWSALPEFKQVILRHVSKDNFGIQFICIYDVSGTENPSQDFQKIADMQELVDSNIIYAYDISYRIHPDEDIVILKDERLS